MTPVQVPNTNFYNLMFTELADPRTKNWFLMDSPVPGLIILATYLFFVTTWGPRYMRNRKPVELGSILIAYNFLQVLISTFLVYQAVNCVILRKDFSWNCQPLILEPTTDGMREAKAMYFYFLAKMTELLDTVFFILRKKRNQVTFLHIYHHTAMLIFSWSFTKYCPGGHIIFAGGLNSFVHIFMYLYYMLAAYGPQIQKYLWWKKYITILQMVQFVMVFLHDIQPFFVECNYPKFTLTISLSSCVLFFFLFGDFYGNAYKEKKAGSHSHKSGTEEVKLHQK